MAKKIVKGICIFLLILLLLFGILFIVLKIYASKNNPVMFDTISDGMSVLRKKYAVKELDAGKYQDMRFYGIMDFHVDQYEVKNLGNLSVMTADMGFMQMVSFLITPFEKNAPMCTLDFMYIFGTRKSYVEFYDLGADTNTDEYRAVQTKLKELVAGYSDIEEIPTKKNWYDNYLNVFMHKKLSSDDDERNKEMFLNVLKTYVDATQSLPVMSAEEQQKQVQNTQEYCDGLISKGGVSTDVFKKALGEEKTHDFFNKVFFGTKHYPK